MASSNIPEDLIIEIFKRLPVRSILRLRCACKKWRALTRSPNFINIHLQFNQTIASNDRLFVKHWDEEANTTVFSLFPMELQDGLPLNLNLEFLNNDISIRHFEIAYCNGILCVHNHTCLIALWNPATRELKRVPFLPHIKSTDQTVTIAYVGFGFDYKKTNDYKIVALVLKRNWDSFGKYIAVSAHIYSLRRSSWRAVDVFVPRIATPYDYSIYTNGFLHWATKAYYPSVVSFDLGEESFKLTPMPVFPTPERDPLPLKLASLNGLVNVIYSTILFSESNTYFEVWVMKDCGVKESWTRKYIVKLPGKFLMARGLWKKGELIIEHEGSVYLYDPNSQQTSDLQFRGYRNRALEAFIYQESLVPIVDIASPIF